MNSETSSASILDIPYLRHTHTHWGAFANPAPRGTNAFFYNLPPKQAEKRGLLAGPHFCLGSSAGGFIAATPSPDQLCELLRIEASGRGFVLELLSAKSPNRLFAELQRRSQPQNWDLSLHDIGLASDQRHEPYS